MIIKLEAKVEPTPMARAMTTFKNGRVWSYTPKATKNAMDELKYIIQSQCKESFPIHTPLTLTVTFYRTKPATSKDNEPVRKPDLSNYIKGIEDCMSGLVYQDDAAICKLIAEKRWTDKEYPYITIELSDGKNDVPQVPTLPIQVA